MKIKDCAIITVRNSSTRLPNKSLMIIKDNLRSIDIVLERAKKTELPVIIATSTESEDNIFEDIAKQHNVKIFRGALLNKLKRWSDCFSEYGIENALLIDGDDLAYNFEIGKRALTQLKSNQSELVICTDDIVTGFFTYAIKKSGIVKLYHQAPNEETDTDVPTKYIEKANLIKSYIKLYNYERNQKIRLTLDYEEDLNFFKKLYEKLDITETGKNIVKFLNENPHISQINIEKQKDFLENQKKFTESANL